MIARVDPRKERLQAYKQYNKNDKALTSFCRNEIVYFWNPWGL